MRPGLRSVVDRTTVYLPVVLMASLALGTYWLVRLAPTLAGATLLAPLRHETDFDLQQFSVRSYERDGRLRAEMLGTTARHYPDDDTLEIDEVRLRNWDSEGRQTIATARAAVARSDGSQAHLRGDAEVVREAFRDATGRQQPAWLFRSQQLQSQGEHTRVTTAQPVEIRHGVDRFSADAMHYDGASNILQLQGRVRAELQPRKR